VQCQLCDKVATVHLTEIVGGKKTERHLCEQCAQNENIMIKAQPGISELLTSLVAAHDDAKRTADLHCPQCHMTWSEFRKGGMLGCANDYVAFDKSLRPLIERAHDGASMHRGRIPKRTGKNFDRQVKLLRLRQDLQRAVRREDYEAAARIRDDIASLKN